MEVSHVQSSARSHELHQIYASKMEKTAEKTIEVFNCTNITWTVNYKMTAGGHNMDFYLPCKEDGVSSHVEVPEMVQKQVFIPAGKKTISRSPAAPEGGKEWTSIYSFNAVEETVKFGELEYSSYSWGMNSENISIGILSLKETEYNQVPKGQEDKALCAVDVAEYILGMCKDLDEVEKELTKIYICSPPTNLIKHPGFHFQVADGKGGILVIEILEGVTKLYREPEAIGILTNDPDYEWHMKNLERFTPISSERAPDITYQGRTFPSFDLGSRSFGWQGDKTPRTRFESAFLNLHLGMESHRTKERALTLSARTLENVAQIHGISELDRFGETFSEYTNYTVIWIIDDLNNEREVYYRGYTDLSYKEWKLLT